MFPQVVQAVDAYKTGIDEQAPHGLTLIVTVLYEQPAARVQIAWGASHDHTQIIQPVRTGDQGARRIEPHIPCRRCGSSVRIYGGLLRIALNRC